MASFVLYGDFGGRSRSSAVSLKLVTQFNIIAADPADANGNRESRPNYSGCLAGITTG
jgi:hypothetical protein